MRPALLAIASIICLTKIYNYSFRKVDSLHQIKITRTNTGSHDLHWQAIFNREEVEKSGLGHLSDALKSCEDLVKNNSTNSTIIVDPVTIIITDPLVRTIIRDEGILSIFPCLKGVRYELFETKSITEWSDSYNLEASIKVTHPSGCSISFFATDYAINKNIYKNQKNLTINLLGLAYAIQDFDVKKWNRPGEINFDNDFCGYLLRNEGDEVDFDDDEIHFFGRIRNIAEHSFGEVEGFLLTVGITPEFNLDVFIAKKNLSTKIEINKAIHGIAWIQGTLER